MSFVARRRLLTAVLLLFATSLFLPGINWGLPSREIDPSLFGEHKPWSGAEILSLAPRRPSEMIAADVDANPLLDRAQAIVVNSSDEQRAEIVRRYRLFSYQPDEMITFSALSEMRPGAGQLDPKLYQYGGLWIYPVGGLLKFCSLSGMIPLRHHAAFYLDHPEVFGRFYVTARLYVVAWGLIGVWVVFWLVNRVTASLIASTCAALCYAAMPVVVNMAHEAKPHLPGAVLMLLAIAAAVRYVETGRTRWWLLTSILCGAAAGMVLSGAVALVIIPAMLLVREWNFKRFIVRGALGVLVAVAVYFITNPYVAINLATNRAILRSNFSNTAAMYGITGFSASLVNAVKLVREGSSLGILLAGSAAIVALTIRAALRMRRRQPIAPVGPLLVAPVIVILAQFVALAGGKPAEYGRFAILADISLAIAASAAIGIFTRRTAQRIVGMLVLFSFAAVPSWFYLRGFYQDSTSNPTRLDEARWLAELHRAGARKLGIFSEPAPYCLPPVDLFQWEIVLLPREFDIASHPIDVDVIVRAVDELEQNGVSSGQFVQQSLIGPADAFPTRISWAGKPFEVWIHVDLLERMTATTVPGSPGAWK